MEKQRNQQIRTESKAALIEQINLCLSLGDYPRALDVLRGTAAEFPNDAKLSELEKLAQDGLKRNAEANRLITESQNLFAQQKSAEAIQLLRQAYELDKHNSLARAILANALVEHAHSMVETDWREAEALAKQALDVNPAHPTAKNIRSLVLERKKSSSVEDWVAQARKLQSSGDLFASLAWIEEGMAFHPDDPKLLQIQDAILRDQAAQRRQSRRRDLEDLRRMESGIEGATDVAAKQALAERIQGVAAKYWTDGEFLTVANGLLQRLGLAPQESSTTSSPGKGATVIFHVPRPSPTKPTSADASQGASPSAPLSMDPHTEVVAPIEAPPSKGLPSIVAPAVVPTRSLEPVPAPAQAATITVSKSSEPASDGTRTSSQPKKPNRSNSTTLIVLAAAAIVLVAVAATFFLTRKHYDLQSTKTPSPAATRSLPDVPAPPVSGPRESLPATSAPAVSAPTQTAAAPSPSPSSTSSDTAAGKVTPDGHPKNDQPMNDEPLPESSHNRGTLVVVAGQDDAKIFLNGKLQSQLTQSGQLRLLNLEPRDYVVQISKSGFQDPPEQRVRIRNGQEARLVFKLQPQSLQAQKPPTTGRPQPSLASLTVQGGTPGATVVVDQTPIGTIQPDGTLSVSSINPGDHALELRKDRFKSRQFKKHFIAGASVSLLAADAALDAAPSELKITFTPADAKVAVVKGDLLKMISSGVPLNLPAGTYTLSARTPDGFTRSSTLEVIAGQSKTVDLPLAPNGMTNWDDPGAWRRDGDSFTRKGGDFVLYRDTPASGTFVFSAMLTKGRLLQWVLNYTDPKNYILLQMDDNNFYRTVIRNGEKTDEVKVPDKADKKSFRTLHIRISPTEIVQQIKHGNSWTVLDRWRQPGGNLSPGKFGFYLPGNDQLALSSFAHYVDLNIR